MIDGISSWNNVPYVVWGQEQKNHTNAAHHHQQQQQLLPRAKIDMSQVQFRIKNSHCIYFGIYSFNLTKWRSLDSGELHTWCNSSKAKTAYEQHRSDWIRTTSVSNAAERYDKIHGESFRKLKPGHYRNYLVGYLKVNSCLYLRSTTTNDGSNMS